MRGDENILDMSCKEINIASPKLSPTGRQKDDAKRKTKERLALKNRGRIQDPEAHLRYHPEPRPAQTEV